MHMQCEWRTLRAYMDLAHELMTSVGAMWTFEGTIDFD